MSYVIQVVLSNARHPEYGQFTRAAIPVKNGWVLPRTVSPRWILSISKMVSNIFSRITKNWKVSGQTLWWWKRWSGSINNSISQIWA